MNGKDYRTYKYSKKEMFFYFIFYSTILYGIGVLFFRSYAIAVLGIILVPVFMNSRRKSLFDKRNKSIRNEFCDALQIVSVSLSSGKSINVAFIEAASELNFLYGIKSGIINKEFWMIAKKLSMNHNLKELMEDLAGRTKCEEIQSFQEAEELCRITGGNIVEIVRNIYQTILQKNEVEDDIEIICAEQKLNFRILMIVPFVLMTIMNFTSGDYMNALFTSLGRIFVIIFLSIIFFAYLIGSRMLAEERVIVKVKKKPVGKADVNKENKVISKVLNYLNRYTYERNFTGYFLELYDNENRYFHKKHRKEQLIILLAALIFLVILMFLFGVNIELFVLILASVIGLIIIKDRSIREKALKRRKIIDSAMPMFLSKLAILTDAGVSIKTAIERITIKMTECELKKQLMILLKDFSCGKSDDVCFENFARRCKTKETSAFSTLMVQSIRKGGRELSAILRMHAKTSWDKKKMHARIKGEEKSMKLMFPTMLIFIALMLLMAAPAIVKMGVVI